MHLSLLPQVVRNGFLGPIQWAVIEACDVTPGGGTVLSTAVRDRIGSPICVVPAGKVAGIVLTNQSDEVGGFDRSDEITDAIGRHVAEFLVSDLQAGRIPKGFVPLQSGVGNIANSVLAALGGHPEIPPFEMYTEVLQDAVIPLLQNGRCTFASTCSLTLGPEKMKEVTSNLEFFRPLILMRPQEMVRRLGIISMNTAIEVDIFGNVNSTHIMGRQMMNGIGGSGDFTRNAYLSVFSCPSTAKDGKISTIVPRVSHMDP